MIRFIVGVLCSLALVCLGCHDQGCKDDIGACEAWCADLYSVEACVDTSGSLTPPCNDCGGETCALTQVCCSCYDDPDDETFEVIF